jgi:hypothetical protein
MTEKEPRKEGVTDPKLDDVLRRLLNTPPQPRKKKTKEEKPAK